MSEYATKGAMLTCTCGAAPSQLQVTSNTFYSVQGNTVATTNDKAPMANIMPFGTCSLKPVTGGFLPCVPAPTVWTGFLTSVQVGSGNPLLKTSTIQCGTGGCISFQNSGQMKPEKVVINPSSPQIDVLQRAAIEAVPFCEECEKKKQEKNPKILRIYWMDEQGEPRGLSELLTEQPVTVCIDVDDGMSGETIDITINAPEGKSFKDGGTQKKYSNLIIEDDNTAYIDNFTLEYNN